MSTGKYFSWERQNPLQSARKIPVTLSRKSLSSPSFAQRPAHRDSRIWRPELIEPAAERKRRARARGRRPTLKSAYPDPQILPQCNISSNYPIKHYYVWFFWVSRHKSIILVKKMETFSGRFWEIPGNVLKLELLKRLIYHINASVFFQAVSGKSSWSFVTDEPNTNEKKTATGHPFIALLAREEKNKDVFSSIFSFECPFSTPLWCNISSKYPT